MKTFKKIIIILALILTPAFFEGCGNNTKQDAELTQNGKDNRSLSDLEEIQEKGKLVVVTDYNSTSYFIYRGQPMGYQYQMLQELATYLDLRLEVKVSNDLEDSFNNLNQGDIDLIAINLTVTADRMDKVTFTSPHTQTRQVLVQRMPANYKKMNASQLTDSLIRNQLDLAGKTIHVQKGSAYAKRLESLSNEIGAAIDIVEVPVEAEQLIHMVARGEIDYTVSDENVARVNKSYFPFLDVSTAISFNQKLAWAVRKGSVDLKKEIDTWLDDFRTTRRYAVIYNKYFDNQQSVSIVKSDYYALGSGKISKYDDAIKRESERIGWDWRLVSSMVYQESRFNPNAVSWAGAYGLMQLMPRTGNRFGVGRKSSPEAQIRAGISFIKWLDNRFDNEIPDRDERTKFVLASYNVGKGHVDDARRLAEKYGDDPNIWDDNVGKWLLNKSQPNYYHDPVVKYGYARGIETYNYVKQVINRYEHYKNIIDSDIVTVQLVP